MISDQAFSLQLGHPKIISGPHPAVKHLQDIFPILFHADEEALFLFWHRIPIRFRYREDLYNNFDLLLAMTWLIQKETEGATKIDLMTPLLFIHWEFFWEENDLLIKAKFQDTEDLFAPYAIALNNQPEVVMSKMDFLREWKMLLHQIIIAIRTAEVSIEDGKERRKWELMQKVDQAIKGFGILYQINKA